MNHSVVFYDERPGQLRIRSRSVTILVISSIPSQKRSTPFASRAGAMHDLLVVVGVAMSSTPRATSDRSMRCITFTAGISKTWAVGSGNTRP